jgi:hypothetical protein
MLLHYLSNLGMGGGGLLVYTGPTPDPTRSKWIRGGPDPSRSVFTLSGPDPTRSKWTRGGPDPSRSVFTR